jgi:hypothetical protein
MLQSYASICDGSEPEGHAGECELEYGAEKIPPIQRFDQPAAT